MNRPRAADAVATVTARDEPAADVVVLTLHAAPGSALPDWEPGAHVDALLPSDKVRQYSLCGDPADDSWRIAVYREPDGRGGSAWIADTVRVGSTLRLAGPRTHFRFDPPEGAPVAFVAGGIGVTPLLPMAREARAAGRDYRLHYLGRSRSRLAFLDELAAAHGDRLTLHVTDERTRLDVDAFVASLAPGTQVYACGPTPLLDALQAACDASAIDLHVERFESALTEPVWHGPFEVELAASGITVEVPPEKSVLQAIEEQGVLVLSSCTEGTCGTCETVVLEGEVDHRDAILTPAERARNDVMFVCVSRAACPRLVLEL